MVAKNSSYSQLVLQKFSVSLAKELHRTRLQNPLHELQMSRLAFSKLYSSTTSGVSNPVLPHFFGAHFVVPVVIQYPMKYSMSFLITEKLVPQPAIFGVINRSKGVLQRWDTTKR